MIERQYMEEVECSDAIPTPFNKAHSELCEELARLYEVSDMLIAALIPVMCAADSGQETKSGDSQSVVAAAQTSRSMVVDEIYRNKEAIKAIADKLNRAMRRLDI